MIGEGPSRTRALAVRALDGLGWWRLAHERRLFDQCLICGERVVLERDKWGRVWKVHEEDPVSGAHQDCMAVSKVPRPWALDLFELCRLSPILKTLDRASRGFQRRFCLDCGGEVPVWCNGCDDYRDHRW